MTTIAVDGLSEEEFRRSIENRLRDGQPGVAIERLRGLLAPFAGPGRILPERFLTVEASDLVLTGWQVLEPAITRHDRPGRPVTALSVAFGWPGEEPPQPDDQGNLRPHIETGYFSDDAFPFSQSARDDLLDGYSIHGCTWAADCIASDNALSLEGIDDLHGALAALESRLLASEWPDEEELRAGSLGACLLSVLLFQAVSKRIERDGMPRPLCIMAGSNGVYPYFDAPVAGFPEDARQAAEAEEEELNHAVPGPRYSSLLMTGVPRGRKRAVLVLNESDDEAASRIAQLRGLDPAEDLSRPVEAAGPLPPPEPFIPEPPIGESPLLTKKHPSEKPWDFRDMLGPREPERQQEPREEIDWGDWSETPPPQDRGPAPAPPPENIPEQADWDSWHDAVPPPIPEPEPTVPDLEPVDEVEPEPVAQEDWSEDLPDPMRVIGPDTSATQDAAIESPISDWAAPAASDVELEPSEPAQSDLDPADWGEPGSIDWGETEAFGEPDPMAPVVWPDPEEDPQPRPPEIESEAETLPCPGFELLDPVVNAPLVLPQEPVLVLDVAAFDLEPLTVREEPDQSWVFGTGWLDGDTEEAAARSEPEPAPFTLWSRMRVWLRWR